MNNEKLRKKADYTQNFPISMSKEQTITVSSNYKYECL